MVFHPTRGVEHGSVATQDDRHVGGQGREVGVRRKIDADQLDPVGSIDRISHGFRQCMHLGLDSIAEDDQPDWPPGLRLRGRRERGFGRARGRLKAGRV